MNPYSLYLYSIPSFFAVISAFPKHRVSRLIFILIATGIYWYILPKYVDWAYTHPFNPNDGGPRAFSALFGWLVGLVTLILPIHFGIVFAKWGIKKITTLNKA